MPGENEMIVFFLPSRKARESAGKHNSEGSRRRAGLLLNPLKIKRRGRGRGVGRRRGREGVGSVLNPIDESVDWLVE